MSKLALEAELLEIALYTASRRNVTESERDRSFSADTVDFLDNMTPDWPPTSLQPLIMASILSPIREGRDRLDTGDTTRIRNYPLPVNYKQSISKNGEDEDDDDDSSIVSSLSNDDSLRRLPPVVIPTAVHVNATPPSEVSIPAKETCESEVPDWLDVDRPPRPRMERVVSASSAAPSAPMVWTSGPSPVIPRPTHGRNKSCPAMDFSIGSCTHSEATHSGTFSATSSYETMKLLGQRKQRDARSARSGGSISIGSIVGQSSLVTGTTTTSSSSYTGSETSSVIRDKQKALAQRKLLRLTGAEDGVACCRIHLEDQYRKRSMVKEELKHAWGIVSSPIRVLKKSESSVDLQRASGCLT